MSRRKRGVLPEGVELVALTPLKQPRCQFVMAPKPEEGDVPVRQCQKLSLTGREYCEMHGGRAGRPPKTGRNSKFNPVPMALRKRFEDAQSDPDLLSVIKQISLLDAKIWAISEKASSRKDFTKAQLAELLQTIRAQKELISQETERRVALGTTMDVRDVLVLIGYIYDSIQRNVHEEAARRKVGADLRRLVEGVTSSAVSVLLPTSLPANVLEEGVPTLVPVAQEEIMDGTGNGAPAQ